MTCPRAPKRGHRPGSQRGLECPFCSTSGGNGTHSGVNVGSGSASGTGRAPRSIHPSGNSSASSSALSSAATSATLAERGEQVLRLLQAGRKDKQLEQALQILLDESAKVVGETLKRPRRGHFLCELLEQAALALQELLDAPGSAVEEIVDSLTPHWLPRAILKTALKSLLDAAINTAALKALHLQLAGAAIVLCSNPTKHPSLDNTCATPLAKAGISLGYVTDES